MYFRGPEAGSGTLTDKLRSSWACSCRVARRAALTCRELSDGCTQGSVEQRIIEVAKMRRTAGGIPSGAFAMPSIGRASGRNAVAATAGSMRQDKTDLRINALEMLFRDPEFTPP